MPSGETYTEALYRVIDGLKRLKQEGEIPAMINELTKKALMFEARALLSGKKPQQ